jgi:hypothetical protein
MNHAPTAANLNFQEISYLLIYSFDTSAYVM